MARLNALLDVIFIGLVFMTINMPGIFAVQGLRESANKLIRFPGANGGDDATYGKHDRKRKPRTVLRMVCDSACGGPEQEDAHNCQQESCCAHEA